MLVVPGVLSYRPCFRKCQGNPGLKLCSDHANHVNATHNVCKAEKCWKQTQHMKLLKTQSYDVYYLKDVLHQRMLDISVQICSHWNPLRICSSVFPRRWSSLSAIMSRGHTCCWISSLVVEAPVQTLWENRSSSCEEMTIRTSVAKCLECWNREPNPV